MRFSNVASGVIILIAAVVASLIPANMQIRTGLHWQVEHFLVYFTATANFCPACPRPFLVAVARPGRAPSAADVAVFLTAPHQGVNYAPGVWHHPMVALDRETDFFCLVYEDGTARDCTEHALGPELRVRVILG